MQIVRTATGTYHKALSSNSGVLFCNHSGQRRRPSVRKAQAPEIAKAGIEMFCKKCFRGERPQITCEGA